MIRHLRTIALLVPLGACGEKSAGVTTSASGAPGASAGTPESVLADDPATAGASAGAAFVAASFDARAAKVVQASCDGKKLRLTLDGVLFDFDHDSLQPGADDVLGQVKRVAVDPYPSARITVEGHTDSVGTDAHNDDLSLRRARTVASWLQAKGIDGSRLETKGYGKRWPRVPNTSDANRAKNRRVEFVVLDQSAGTSCGTGGSGGGGGGGPLKAPTGSGPGGGGGGLPVRSGGSDTVPFEEHPEKFPAFSFRYDDTPKNAANQHDRMCLTFDPKWVHPDGPPMAYSKKDFSLGEGKFLDQCPTENVVASCDRRAIVPAIEWYYAGASEALLDVRKVGCAAGKWTRVGAAAPVAKASNAGPFALVCDHHEKEQRCVEARPEVPAETIAAYKNVCGPGAQPARCPAQGAIGSCEQKGLITFFYAPAADAPTVTPTFRLLCEQTAGTWSSP